MIYILEEIVKLFINSKVSLVGIIRFGLNAVNP
jgi:hypothetical protein